jgi:hypothetical protein
MFDPVSAGVMAGGAVIGAIGSNQAAKKQAEAAKQAAEIARRNMLMSTQMQEPMRRAGYDALGDISDVFGYQQSPYTTQNQLMQTATPMHSKDMAKLLKTGTSFEQLQQMGSLRGLNAKAVKRLTKAGLSMDQITQLQAGYQAPQAAPQQGSAPSGPTGLAAFQASPDYQFRLNEGQRGVGNSFAARGGAASGNALKALTEFNSGTASGEFNNWFQKRMQLASGGQSAANSTQQAGNQWSGDSQGALMAQGDARASGVMGVTNSLAGGLNSYANNRLWDKYLSRPGTPPINPGNQPGPWSGGYQFPGG